jgi:hypothetical protein
MTVTDIRDELARLSADRDSWRQQASDRVDDAVQAMAERDAAIEARKAAQLRAADLQAEIARLEPMRQRAADIKQLTAERDAERAARLAAQRATLYEADLAQQALDDLRAVTDERDSLASAVHMLRADADKMRVELERATAERDEAIRIASAYSPAKELQRSLDQAKASGVEARKERDAAIRERDALRAELEASQAQEPVAWCVLAANGNCITWSTVQSVCEAAARRYERPVTPLYAAPLGVTLADGIGQPSGEDKPC